MYAQKECEHSAQQETITSHFASSSKVSELPLPSSRIDCINQSLINYVIASMEPISTVENPAFCQFVKTLEPRYQLMCRKSLKDKLQNTYTAMKESLKKDMCAVDFVGLTHDGWTSLNTESYDTVTCSYIDKDSNMQCKVLDTLKVCGSHTAENIANCLMQVKTNLGFLSQTLVTCCK